MAEHEIRLDILSYNDFTETVDWRGFRALPDNLPQHLPGMYLAVHLDTGRPYVGIAEDVARRMRAHAMNNSPKRLKAALRKYGKDRFVIMPIYYSVDGTSGLEELEAELIDAFDAIERGFNVCAAKGRVGPYGPMHGKLVSAGITQESREQRRVRAIENFPKSREAFRTAGDTYNKSPEGRLEKAERTRAMWLDPAYREAVVGKSKATKALRHDALSAVTTASWVGDDERRRKTAETFAAVFADPDVRRRSAENSTATRRRMWADPVKAAEIRANMIAGHAARKARLAAEAAAKEPPVPEVAAQDAQPTLHDKERPCQLQLSFGLPDE